MMIIWTYCSQIWLGWGNDFRCWSNFVIMHKFYGYVLFYVSHLYVVLLGGILALHACLFGFGNGNDPFASKLIKTAVLFIFTFNVQWLSDFDSKRLALSMD